MEEARTNKQLIFISFRNSDEQAEDVQPRIAVLHSF